MTVEISDEAYRILQNRVERGEFESLNLALETSIREASIRTADADVDYLAYVRDSIEDGLRDVAEGRTISMEAFLAENEALKKKCA